MIEKSDEDPLLFADEEPSTDDSADPAESLPPWEVLVVDDDESVHTLTQVVLGSFSFRDRPLCLLSAYSGVQAWEMLQERPGVSLILLDVVMEREDAGLRLVRRIREEAGNRTVRIILRTGQPGQAPEREIIRDYDINDYKSKTELTSQKLYSVTIAALRAHADMVELEQSREAMARVMRAAGEVFTHRRLAALAPQALEGLVALLDHHGDALLCARPGGAARGGTGRLALLAGRGSYAHCAGQSPTGLATDIQHSLAGALASRQPGLSAEWLYWSTPDGHDGVVYLPRRQPQQGVDWHYIELYCERVASAFDNAVLHQRLIRRQTLLEQRVNHRTRRLAASNTALAATHKRLHEELQVASALQRAILPQCFPDNPHVHGSVTMQAARQVGGDFYDIFPLQDGRLGFLIADTCGKGVPAAIFMAMARTVLQAVVSATPMPGNCLHEANNLLEQQNPTDLFVTVFYGLLDPLSGELHYANAGHDSPLLRNSRGEIRSLPMVKGPILGIIDNLQYGQGQLRLEPGDTLLLYTDGVTEATNPLGEQYGPERLLACFERIGAAPVEQIVGTVLQSARDFEESAEQSDDVTAMAVRYLG